MSYLRNMAGRVRQRLLDKGIAITKNDRSLVKINNRHKGEKAVIIGMGPSFKISDLELFDGFTTFACNKIYLSFKSTQWRPDYYSICDTLVAENNYQDIAKIDFGKTEMIHAKVIRPWWPKSIRASFYSHNDNIQNWDGDSKTAVLPSAIRGKVLGGGYSVVIEQIQLAYAMGFSEVYLVGIDFSFHGGIETSERSPSGKILVSRGEVNHFHKDYRKPGEKWTVPMMEEQRKAFLYCRYAFESSGRKLINTSRSTKLDVLERREFESIFQVQR